MTETEPESTIPPAESEATASPPAAEASSAEARPAERHEGERRPSGDRGPGGDRGPRGDRGGDDDERPRRRGRRRRVCIMCAEHMKSVDYKDVGFLKRYVSDRARIETRRKSSSCAKHQRAVARAIKRARHMALLPYTPEHIRETGFSTRY